MEGRDAVALLELLDALADFVNVTSDVVALVDFIARPFWALPAVQALDLSLIKFP